jgi:hypothetical protein
VLNYSLASVHQHTAEDESEHGYGGENDCMREHYRISQSEPCGFREGNVDHEKDNCEQNRERHGADELVFTEKISRDFIVKNHQFLV